MQAPPLIQNSGSFAPVPTQAAPSARGQHTAVFDGDDQLIIFGGVDAKDAFAATSVHVLCLSQRRWSTPAVIGEGPGQRARHCAAMLDQNGTRTMAVFGGRAPTVSKEVSLASTFFPPTAPMLGQDGTFAMAVFGGSSPR